MTPNQSIEIFLSFAPEDEELREKLAKHLSSLKHEGVINDWYASKISAGKDRAKEIEKYLNSASVILLLISSDFIDSEELWEIEVTQAMEKHNKQEARVIPVLLRSCVWNKTPFGKLEPLPKNGEFITSWSNQDEAFTNVVQGIQQVVEEISGLKEPKDNSQLQQTKRLWRRIPWRSVFTILLASMALTFLVIVMRLFGVFQTIELLFFDQMMQFQPTEPQDDRLLVIEVTKQDIDDQKEEDRRGSLTNTTLFQILNKLVHAPEQPRAIGLDIYRDYKTKNYPKLSDILTKNPLIFGVCNVGQRQPNNSDAKYGVAPPPEIPVERLGFSDFLSDSEGLVRRQLLSLEEDSSNSHCESQGKRVTDAFSIKLAQSYLKKKYKEIRDGSIHLQLGSTIFELLDSPHRGGYSFWTDLDGYQLLLNYRKSCSEKYKTLCSPEFIAKRVTVTQFLQPGFDQKNLKDKIVLIGLNENSYEGPWFTPFSLGNDRPIPGVVMQAQMISQILSADSDAKRPLLKVLPIWYEILWILLWSLIGGSIAQISRSKGSLIISGGVVFISLYGFCLICFITSIKYWVPFIPPAFTLLSTGGIVLYINWKPQKSS